MKKRLILHRHDNGKITWWTPYYVLLGVGKELINRYPQWYEWA